MIFYNLIYRILRFIIIIVSPLSSLKTKAWIELRFNQEIFQLSVDSKALKIWIHASSGEIEYAKGFIRDFKKAHPQSQIFVSYSSLSAVSLFKNIANEVTAFFPLNWDITEDNTKLINFINPQIIIFSRTDFWPNLIHQAKNKDIKLAAIAVNPRVSFLSYLRLKLTCKSFDFISCVDFEQITFLKQALPQTEVRFIPDTRYDQVFFRLKQKSLVELNPNKKLITFGSTWPKDEEILSPVCKQLLEQNFSIVWAPHDPKNSQKLFESLAQNMPEKRIIKFTNFNDQADFDILILDRVGLLADFYRFSKLSFVGGSFVSKVHSVMEPLCAGNFVIVGPYYQNNPEAVAFKKRKFVLSVRSVDEFLAAVQYFDDHTDKLSDLRLQTESLKGGSLKTLQAIEEILKF